MELIVFSRHSSEIRGLCLLKSISKMLPNLLYFWNVNKYLCIYYFSLKTTFFVVFQKMTNLEEWQHLLCIIFISLNQITSIFFLSQSMRFKIEIVLSPYSIWQGVTQYSKNRKKLVLTNFYFFQVSQRNGFLFSGLPRTFPQGSI